MSVLTSLIKLHKNLGGNPDNIKNLNTVSGLVDKIADVVNPGGPGKGSSVYYIIPEFEYDDSTGDLINVTIKESFNELKALVDEGKILILYSSMAESFEPGAFGPDGFNVEHHMFLHLFGYDVSDIPPTGNYSFTFYPLDGMGEQTYESSDPDSPMVIKKSRV